MVAIQQPVVGKKIVLIPPGKENLCLQRQKFSYYCLPIPLDPSVTRAFLFEGFRFFIRSSLQINSGPNRKKN